MKKKDRIISLIKRNKKILIFLLALYGTYFLLTLPIRIQQKLPSDIEKVSIYEKKTILNELEKKYPGEKFEILAYVPGSDLTLTYLLLGSVGEYKHLMMRKFLVRPVNKPGEEFIIRYDYYYTPGTHMIMALEEIGRVLIRPLAQETLDKYYFYMSRKYFYPRYYNDYRVRSDRGDFIEQEKFNVELSNYLKPRIKELFPNLDFTVICLLNGPPSSFSDDPSIKKIKTFHITVKIISEVEEYLKIDTKELYNNFQILIDEVDKFNLGEYIGSITIESLLVNKTKYDELKNLDTRTLYRIYEDFRKYYFAYDNGEDISVKGRKILKKDGSIVLEKNETTYEEALKDREYFIENLREHVVNGEVCADLKYAKEFGYNKNEK